MASQRWGSVKWVDFKIEINLFLMLTNRKSLDSSPIHFEFCNAWCALVIIISTMLVRYWCCWSWSCWLGLMFSISPASVSPLCKLAWKVGNSKLFLTIRLWSDKNAFKLLPLRRFMALWSPQSGRLQLVSNARMRGLFGLRQSKQVLSSSKSFSMSPIGFE